MANFMYRKERGEEQGSLSSKQQQSNRPRGLSEQIRERNQRNSTPEGRFQAHKERLGPLSLYNRPQKGTVQAKMEPKEKEGHSEAAESTHNLPETLQAKMEHSFGTDFSTVNVHKDSASATELGALAYTQGEDIHFAPGQFNPDSQNGKSLIGHELTHVVQQRQGRVQATKQMKGVDVNKDSALEREADEVGEKIAKSDSVVNGMNDNRASKKTQDGSAGSILQRKALDEGPQCGNESVTGYLDIKYEKSNGCSYEDKGIPIDNKNVEAIELESNSSGIITVYWNSCGSNQQTGVSRWSFEVTRTGKILIHPINSQFRPPQNPNAAEKIIDAQQTQDGDAIALNLLREGETLSRSTVGSYSMGIGNTSGSSDTEGSSDSHTFGIGVEGEGEIKGIKAGGSGSYEYSNESNESHTDYKEENKTREWSISRSHSVTSPISRSSLSLAAVFRPINVENNEQKRENILCSIYFDNEGQTTLVANSEQMDRLNHFVRMFEVETLMKEGRLLEVRGYASTTGNETENFNRAKKRADYIKTILIGRYADIFPSDKVKATADGEWEGLELGEDNSPDPNYRRVDIILKTMFTIE